MNGVRWLVVVWRGGTMPESHFSHRSELELVGGCSYNRKRWGRRKL
jgi:hypothetical protein